MLRSINKHYEDKLGASDGEIGHVKDFYFDDQSCQAKKWIGSFAAALGGLDTLVFAGGIGENAPPVRERICEGLDFLGIKLDKARNKKNAAMIFTNAGRVKVRVIHTNEELMIARSVLRSCPAITAGERN
jgi:acetate kinase